MAISYPLSLPDTGRVRTRVEMVEAVAVTASPFTFKTETQLYDGQLWRAEIEIPRLNAAQAGAWRGFLAQLRGRHGSFLLGDTLGKAPRGTAAGSPGTPVVDGATAAMAMVLPVRGAPANQTGWLLAGDFLQLGSGATSRLYMVTADADTDGSGETSLDIWPGLRVGVSDAASITLTAPKGVFMLAENARGIDIARADTISLDTIRAVEDRR